MAPETDDSSPPDDQERHGTRAVAPREQPGLLRRLILPPAAPLEGMPDPLAGFQYRGPRWLRGPAQALFLLRGRPLVWLGAGLVWGVARFTESLLGADQIVALVAAMLEFAALIGAGYIGWQRPWLFGLAASIVGIVVFLAFGVARFVGGGEPLVETLALAGRAFLVSLPLFAAMGALAGWFGGYWRRRLAEAKARALRDRDRRHR